MKLALLALLAALAAAPAAAEGDVHDCACEAEEFGFAIDCADQATMLASLEFLKTNGCAASCALKEDGTPSCGLHYLIVQSHHDHCPEESIPEDVEDGFHDYDTACTPCAIERAYTAGAPDCPAANCDDGSGNAAYTAMATAGCQADCSPQSCQDDFLTLRVVHDACDHDALSRASEEGLHDMEKACPGVVCNAVDGGESQIVCDHAEHSSHDDHGDEHSSHDEGEEESGAAVASAAAALIGAALLLVA